MRCSSRDHHQRSRRRMVLLAADFQHRLPLDDVDDLIARMRLLGAAVLARRDRHHRGLAVLGLLEHAKETAAMGQRVDDFHRYAVAAARIARTAAAGSAAPKTAEPATRIDAPSWASDFAISAFTPPSTEMSMARVPTSVLTSRTFRWALGMNDWPPKPGFTDITSTRSRSSSTNSSAEGGVDGFSATPARAPSSRM